MLRERCAVETVKYASLTQQNVSGIGKQQGVQDDWRRYFVTAWLMAKFSLQDLWSNRLLEP